MRNKLGIIIVALVVASTIGYAFVAGDDGSMPTTVTQSAPTPNEPSKRPQTQSWPEPPTVEPRTIVASGRYADFTTDRQMEQGFTNTILFFYASWCPECRGFDQAIQSQAIPDGTQILRINYDNSTQLKQQYGVTIQTTFVRVTSDGQFIKKWVGYGQDKSVNAILQNVSG